VLIQLENRLLRRLVRLQQAEERLWRAASRRRGRAGRRAVRLIERERQRLARELHTGIGQLLAAIRIQLEVVAAALPDPPDPVRQALDRIEALAADALDQVRGVSRRLHPPAWQGLSLPEALRQLWETSGIPQRFSGAFDAPPLPREPDPDVKTLLYRAAQEALANAVRHAGASRVDLSLSCNEGQVKVTIQDDGAGFDAARVLGAPPAPGAGIGLRSIREQAADLGGKLLVESGPRGTKLEVSAPLEP
jgi:signal transduction histidine kinase